MLDKLELRWFYTITLSFLGLSIYFLSREMYWVAAAPLALGILYLSIYRMDIILFIIAFSTPLTIILNEKTGGPALSIPSEPLLFGVMVLFIFKILFEGGFDKKILRHPVSLVLFVYLLWMFITSMTSSHIIVSLKHFVSQLWFILPMYFLGTQLFRSKKNISKFIWLYTSSLLIVIIYTIVRHGQNGWTQKAAHWVMSPFYNDHTAYAAALALFLPIFLVFSTDWNKNKNIRTASITVFLVLLVAIILSYTRAAWLSLVVSFAVYLIFRFRIRFYYVAITAITLLGIFLAFQTDIMIKLEKNNQDSASDINKHLKSISNISTDASNLERINRWNSAYRMFEERPFWGWGPGTYQFNYASFQKSSEMTIISTNAGDAGNAHSEYLGPLAEQGVLGILGILFIIGTVIYTGTMIYSRSPDKNIRLLTLGILLGIVSYFAHGFLNNFLDTDKLSVPLWAFIAIIVSIDVYHHDKSNVEDKIQQLN